MYNHKCYTVLIDTTTTSFTKVNMHVNYITILICTNKKDIYIYIYIFKVCSSMPVSMVDMMWALVNWKVL